MRFIVLSTNTADVSDLLAAEGARAGELMASGIFVDIWPKADMSGAVVLAETADEAELRQAVETMPTIAAGAGTFEVIALLNTSAPA
ncbi:muconolactone Delta-isomerase family protein [Rhodococcus sp. G-MC3]|uniref:muconolactone Delta-isomerase family protein n=1 Tax=Rhodococcus sp. G-MC3 TaxID=3046209 RepID=UPI0024B9E2FB|nr:muconolactone Delta-isomerase family protein [Rhodococcus sp. G-MC3]MDJ0392436.1 muconolactone Delta-isomerase family protein [Rhodococcus sp. G-MC3]